MRRFGSDRIVPVALFLLTALAAPPATASAQEAGERRAGPIIEDFGAVFDIPEAEFSPPLDRPLRVVFEVAQSAPRPDGVNPRIETLARYLNMHARAGVPRENMELALVVHGSAAWEMASDDAYREQFGVSNPNLPLLEALRDEGVQLLLCGQSQRSRGIPADGLAAPVRLALSAMTALVDLQDRGYRLIAF